MTAARLNWWFIQPFPTTCDDLSARPDGQLNLTQTQGELDRGYEFSKTGGILIDA